MVFAQWMVLAQFEPLRLHQVSERQYWLIYPRGLRPDRRGGGPDGGGRALVFLVLLLLSGY